LLTSYWNGKPGYHREEIEAAVVANLMNRQLEQVCIVYDSATRTNSCVQLTRRLYRKGQRLSGWDHETEQRLTCINRTLGQPSYHELFQIAFAPKILRGDVVVLANADTALDNTVAKLRPIQVNKLATLSITDGPLGLDGKGPQTRSRKNVRDMEHYYKTNVPATFKPVRQVPKRCTRGVTCSWDAYVFRRDSTIHDLGLGSWHDYYHRKGLKFKGGQEFYMNQPGAENAGACFMHTEGMKRRLMPSGFSAGTPKKWQASDACLHVNLFHFHYAPASHHKGDNLFFYPSFVPNTLCEGCSRSCGRLSGCLQRD
jgi:hypothetical protein